MQCPSHGLPQPLRFPWLPSLGSSTRWMWEGKKPSAGAGALPPVGPCGPRPISFSSVIPGVLGPPLALCQGRAQGERVPGMWWDQLHVSQCSSSHEPPAAPFPHGQTVLSPWMYLVQSWPVLPSPFSPKPCLRLSQSCQNLASSCSAPDHPHCPSFPGPGAVHCSSLPKSS